MEPHATVFVPLKHSTLSRKPLLKKLKNYVKDSLYLPKPTCNYAVAMAILKILDTELTYQNFREATELTGTESFSII